MKEEKISEGQEGQSVAAEVKPVKTDSEAKFERLVVALTVGAVVFLAFLVIFMCYQLIAIGVKNNKVNQLKADIAALEQEYEQGEETLEIRRKAAYVEWRAREIGYHYADDN